MLPQLGKAGGRWPCRASKNWRLRNHNYGNALGSHGVIHPSRKQKFPSFHREFMDLYDRFCSGLYNHTYVLGIVHFCHVVNDDVAIGKR